RARDRERRAVRRGAGAHGGAERIAAATDGYGRGAQDHQPDSVRPPARPWDVAGECRPHLRCQARHDFPLRWRMLPSRRCLQCPARYPGAVGAHPIRAGRGTATGRALLERRVVQIPDCRADREYDFPETQKLTGARTVLAIPLLREGVPLGTIGLWKTEVAPFTDKQIELLTTFADQAVIAIENVRPFDEI